MSVDDTEELRAEIARLAQELAQLRDTDEIREVEVRALRQDVALKAEYIERLEAFQAEVVEPKDVHIRNLEAIIAQLRTENPSSETADEVTSRRGVRRLRRQL